MTKNEFIQEAALRIVSTWSSRTEFTIGAVAPAAKALADDVWAVMDDESAPSGFPDGTEPEVLSGFPDDAKIYDVAEEIARLEALDIEKRKADARTKGRFNCYYQKGGLDIRFLGVCKHNRVHQFETVKELISMGRHDFSSLPKIGPKTMYLLDQALDNLYNIKSW